MFSRFRVQTNCQFEFLRDQISKMKPVVTFFLVPIFSLLLPSVVLSQEDSATVLDITDLTLEENTGLTIDEFLWQKRLFIIFSDSPFDPNYIEQLGFLEDGVENLDEREVVVMLDYSPDAESAIRTEFRPRGFAILLIGKDGTVYLRKPTTWNVREISHTIDKFPIRQQELRAKN